MMIFFHSKNIFCYINSNMKTNFLFFAVTGIEPKKTNRNNESKNGSFTLKYINYQSGINTLTDYHTFESVIATNNKSSQINPTENYFTTSKINNSEMKNDKILNGKIIKNKSNNNSLPSKAKYSIEISQNTQVMMPKNTLIIGSKNYSKEDKLLRFNLRNNDTLKQVDSFELINGINDNLAIKNRNVDSKKNNITIHNTDDQIVIDNNSNDQPIKHVVFLPKITKLNQHINKVNVDIPNNMKKENYIYKNSNDSNKHDKIKNYHHSFLSTINSDNKKNNNYTVSNFFNTGIEFWKRSKRETPKNACEKFENDDPSKNEFYSPNYPQNYQASVDCVRVLEGTFEH